MNLSMIIGCITGILFGLLFVFIIKVKITSDRSYRTKYDERQMIVRGRGYRISFWLLIILLALYMTLDAFGVSIPIGKNTILLVMIMISVMIHTIYCIFNDGYFGLNTKPKAFYIMLIVIGLFEFGVGISIRMRLIDNDDSNAGLCFFFGSMFVIIGICIIIKNIISKEKGDEEDEEDDE